MATHPSARSAAATASRQAFIGLRFLLAMTVLLGVLYPALVFGVGRLMPARADGSMVSDASGSTVGSSLIGQQVEGDRWFQNRPSAADYDGQASGASNLAADSQELTAAISQRRALIAARDGVTPDQVPVDAVTASASGLDPDISPAYARIQVQRVAAANGLEAPEVQQLVEAHVEGRMFGFLGEEHVNVLELNLALQRLAG